MPATNVIESLMEKYQGNNYPAMMDCLGEHLGVSPESLTRLGVGYAPIVQFKERTNYDGTWAIPERDEDGVVVGIGLRFRDDKKFMFPGSKHGLIYAVNPQHVRGGYSAGPANWIRTMDAGLPCPVCDKPDGCLISADNPADPKAAICIRVKENAKRSMKLGYLHVLKPEGNLVSAAPLPNNGGPVIIVEGMSDTAAAMDLGFDAVGRPSNLGGLELLGRLIRGRPVIIVGENDIKPDGKQPGKEGVDATALALSDSGCLNITTVTPPVHIKDLRVWKVKYGLTREGFLAYVAEKGQKPDLAEARKNRSALTPLTTGDEFFHDGSTAYVTTTVKECRRETFRVNSTEYAEVLSYRHDQQKGKAPSKQAIGEWQATLCGRAKHDGPPRSVYVRIAYDKESNCIYFDLADAERHVVQISSDGWKVIRDTDCEVRFIRPHGQLGLPLPVFGGSLDELCPLLNVPSDDFPLIPGWLLGVFLPMGEMPGLAFSGQQGSGKSEACRMLRQLVDPAEVDNRPLSDERNLFVAAGNLFVLLFDNLSSIPPTMADVLCRLLSGSGYAIRQNYSDNQEILFRGRRPLLFNGIPSELCDRADLRDRVICVNLPPIDSKHRKSKTQLQDYFEAARPRILGALLSAVATALKRRDEVQITESPRMADFFRFVVAAEPSLPFPAGSFARAYEQDRRAATDLAIENSVVATTILRLLSKQPTWEGTSKQLLAEIDDPAYSRSRDSWDTPRNAKAVSIAVQRIAPALRARGIEVIKGRHTEAGNLIYLRRVSS